MRVVTLPVMALALLGHAWSAGSRAEEVGRAVLGEPQPSWFLMHGLPCLQLPPQPRLQPRPASLCQRPLLRRPPCSNPIL